MKSERKHKTKNKNCCIAYKKRNKRKKDIFYFLVSIAFVMFLVAVYISKWN
jgi:hypothetical protein